MSSTSDFQQVKFAEKKRSLANQNMLEEMFNLGLKMKSESKKLTRYLLKKRKKINNFEGFRLRLRVHLTMGRSL